MGVEAPGGEPLTGSRRDSRLVFMQRRNRVRFKRFVRSLALLLLVPAVLVGFRLAWGMEASHRLAVTRARLRAMGMPTCAADLPDPSKIPPEQDAVIPFEHAMALFKLSPDDLRIVSPDVTREPVTAVLTDAEIAALERIAGEHQQTFDELDTAAKRNQYGWPISEHYYFGTDSHYSFAESNEVIRLLGWMAVIDASGPRDLRALADLRRMVSTAHISDQNPMLLAHLIAIYEFLQAAEFTERLIPQMDWSNPQTQAEGKLLLAEFQRDFNAPDFARTWDGETVFLDSLISESGRPGTPPLLMPVTDDDEARGLELYARGYASAAASDYPDSKAKAPGPIAHPDTRLAAVLYRYSSDAGAAPERYHLLHSRDLAACRAAEMLLAAELFRKAQGHYPKTAAELVPAFLPKAPADPFNQKNEPLHYRLDEGGPTVWSVGLDGDGYNGVPSPLAPPNRFNGLNARNLTFGAGWRKHLADLSATKVAPPPAAATATGNAASPATR